MRTFDIIIIGAGLSGCAAAIAASRRGKSVALIERGKRPGAKNVIGGILYSSVLDRLIPDFSTTAPIERHVVSRSFSFLTGDSNVSFEVGSDRYNQAPDFNRSYTIRRTQFDPWLVAKAKEAGAVLVPSTVVDGLLHQDNDPNGPVIGVRCRRENGEIGARVVIIAEGANALIAESDTLRAKTQPDEVMLGVKQIRRLDRTRIEDRFRLSETSGRAFEFFGDPARGGFGSGFVYTNLDSLSAGITVSLAHLRRIAMPPPEMLDRFLAHPVVAPLIRDSEPIEYCAHLLPIGTTVKAPQLVRDGVILAGDAARLANMSHYKELSNLVTASGVAAGEAAADAIDRNDTSSAGLKGYTERLASGFVFRDIKKYERLADLVENSPGLLEKYPRLIVDAMVEHFSVSEKSKEEVERAVLRAFNREVKPAELRRVMMDVLDAMGFALMPLMRKMVAPSLVPSWNWKHLFQSKSRKQLR